MTGSSRQLLAAVARTIREHDLARPGDTLVVGFSGGADSTALLHILSCLPGLPLNLVAAHLNHGLRGHDSDQDQQFCRLAAERLSIPFETGTIDVAAAARHLRCGLEDAGRRVRMQFLEEVRLRHCAAAVALAHHADDQAETMLMRLLRGAGPAGLAAMRIRTSRHQIRPLLYLSRIQIERYLSDSGLAWREDSSNHDTRFLRNHIRHRIMPLLEKTSPSAGRHMSSTAQLLADDNHLLDTLAQAEFDRLARCSAESIVFDVQSLAPLHPALTGRIIRLAYGKLTGNLLNLTSCHINSIRNLLDDGPPNRVTPLPSSLNARREYGRLVVARNRPLAADPGEVHITGCGRFKLWDGLFLTVEEYSDNPRRYPGDYSSVVIDQDQVPFPWLARTFQPGDRFQPGGMRGTKKLKDLFIDLKLPLEQRRRIPLLLSAGRLFWVAGIRLGGPAAAASPNCRPVTVRLESPPPID